MTNHAPDWIAHHALCSPDRIAMTDVHSSRSYTYGQMEQRCARLASFFRHDYNVRKGDRVAVIAYNSTDIFEVQFACRKLGAVFVPLNWRLSKAELKAILENAEPALIVFGSEYRGVVDYLHDAGVASKLRMRIFRPPAWKMKLAMRNKPPTWNNGRKVRPVEPSLTCAFIIPLTPEKIVMRWVMIAPFGRPVVPEVYMIAKTSSCVTCSIWASGTALVMPAS